LSNKDNSQSPKSDIKKLKAEDDVFLTDEEFQDPPMRQPILRNPDMEKPKFTSQKTIVNAQGDMDPNFIKKIQAEGRFEEIQRF